MLNGSFQMFPGHREPYYNHTWGNKHQAIPATLLGGSSQWHPVG